MRRSFMLTLGACLALAGLTLARDGADNPKYRGAPEDVSRAAPGSASAQANTAQEVSVSGTVDRAASYARNPEEISSALNSVQGERNVSSETAGAGAAQRLNAAPRVPTDISANRISQSGDNRNSPSASNPTRAPQSVIPPK